MSVMLQALSALDSANRTWPGVARKPRGWVRSLLLGPAWPGLLEASI